ncbi:DHA2 family efflux MFS transporter permease subunit [Amycolatopsis anabasis]|uniref:DHA2 family efflux MFS transporter permease subunit n=1 Tax=Amycolatopsis anabasis TaxID=1840409 RepID=UPI001FE65A5B|nr:DHA2 family efflux MFS transporter permease subunit [Amycolatopsis anabasis]
MSTITQTAVPADRMPRHERLVLALACLGSFVVILDATIVSVALPDVRTELGFSPAALPWVVNAYTLAFAGFLLLGGRCADVFGRRRVLFAGMSLFTLASLAGGLAVSPWMLLAARAVQGLGGALLIPSTLSVLTSTFTEGARRARVLSTWSAVGAVAAAAGPVLGGVLTQWLGWRWVFFVNVPVGVVALIGVVTVLPRHDRSGKRGRLDLVGAVLATAGLVGVVYAVMESSAAGWGSAQVLGALAAGVVLLGIFLLHQARWAADPLMPPAIFRVRSVSSGNVVMFLLGLGFFAGPLLISFDLQYVHGFTPLQAGVGFLPMGVAMFAGARSAGALTVRFGARRAAIGCLVVGALGFAWMAVALADAQATYLFSVALPGLVFGFGTSSAFTPITVAATSGVPATQNGVAAGLLNTIRQTSGAVGLAVITTLAAAVSAGESPAALAHGYSAAFIFSACCVATAAVVAAFSMPRTA